uniref:Uncharacterized protein n=3 Tax=Parascaris univalens TaxID=6257 RepID=A0A915A043_PARUN
DATIENSTSSAGIDVESLKASEKVKPAEVKRAATSNDVFPDFSGLSARTLGFVRQERPPIHEPSVLPQQPAVSNHEYNVEQCNSDRNKDEVSVKPTSVASPQSSSTIISKTHAKVGASKSAQVSSNMACAQRSSQSRMFGMPPYTAVGVRTIPKVKKTFKQCRCEAKGEIDVRKEIPKHGEQKGEEKEGNVHNEVVTSSCQFAAPLTAFFSTTEKNIRRQTSDIVNGDNRRGVLSPFVKMPASASTAAPAEYDERPRIKLIFKRENGRANFSIASSSVTVSPTQSSSILTKSSAAYMQTLQTAPTNLESSSRIVTDALNASTSSEKKNRSENSMKAEGGKPERSKNKNVKGKTNDDEKRDRSAKHRKRRRTNAYEATKGEHASKVPKIRIKIPDAWKAAKAQQVDNRRLRTEPIASEFCAQEICNASDNVAEGAQFPSVGTCVASSGSLSDEMGVGRNVKLSNNLTSTRRERDPEQSRSKKTRRHVKRTNCTANAEWAAVPTKASRKSSVTLFSNPAKFLGNRPHSWINSLADAGGGDSVDERKA